jgi:phosphate transport system substrate-binding protein
MDGARRSRILAEVGARAPKLPTAAPTGTPIAAPGATYASRAAVAPTSERTAAAREALAERNARRQAASVAAAATPAANKEGTADTKLADVQGSVVAAPDPGSLKGVRSDAVTVADAASRGSDFARVRSDSHVSRTHAEPARLAATHVTTHKVAPGETLYSIARKHHLDVAQIRDWNHLAGNTVHAGQVLRLGAR